MTVLIGMKPLFSSVWFTPASGQIVKYSQEPGHLIFFWDPLPAHSLVHTFCEVWFMFLIWFRQVINKAYYICIDFLLVKIHQNLPDRCFMLLWVWDWFHRFFLWACGRCLSCCSPLVCIAKEHLRVYDERCLCPVLYYLENRIFKLPVEPFPLSTIQSTLPFVVTAGGVIWTVPQFCQPASSHLKVPSYITGCMIKSDCVLYTYW